MADAENSNDWGLVQTTTGKIIPRDRAEVLEAERWICQDPGHFGFNEHQGRCRICGEPLVSKVVAVGFKETA